MIQKSTGIKVQGTIPEYYFNFLNKRVEEKRFTNISDAVAYAIRFYVDYLESKEFNYSQELPDELLKEADR